ncbi:MAG: hypothetical protein EP329_07985 [Deltaproteobacteria bacterium]|nr:MAG: hypothetical protein EP329_07985 [Deltaproteobacteria bacterium]
MRIALLTLAFAFVASAAHADVPAWTDEAGFESFCTTLTKAAECPDCVCEAITQSNPTEDAGEASDIPTAVVVKVGGVKEDGTIVARYHVVLGSESKLVDGGVIGDASGHMGNPREVKVEILGSEQRFDMCPGMCPHEPVGMIHAFEVKSTWVEPTEKDGMSKLGSTTDLALCFAPDGKTAGCWLLPIGATSGTVKADPSGGDNDVIKEKETWSRTWKLSESGEVQLRLGKPSGRVPGAINRAVDKTPNKQHLKDIPTRPETKPAAK